jgi:hypothetical protein
LERPKSKDKTALYKNKMTEKIKEFIIAAVITVAIVYYVLRLFAFLYVYSGSMSDAQIKHRPAIEQAHLKAEHLRHGKSNKK